MRGGGGDGVRQRRDKNEAQFQFVGLRHWLRLWFSCGRCVRGSTVMDDNWSQYVIVPLLYVRFCGYDTIIYFSEAPEFIISIGEAQ